MVPTEIAVDKKDIDLGVHCKSAVVLDTVLIEVKSFNNSVVEYIKFLDNPNFQIVHPSYTTS